MPILPGNASERLIELRNQRHLTQQELSKELEKHGLGFFDRATISRAESGKTTRVNVELVEALSKYYGVTADFILGMTDVPDRKSYEISEMGLSYDAARKLLLREVNPDAVNRLLSSESAASLCEMITSYFLTEMDETYREIVGLFPEIKDMGNHAEMLGIRLSEADRKKMASHLAILREPAQMQKDALMKQFELVIGEWIAGMYAGAEDPEPIRMSNQQLMRELRKELLEKKRRADLARITQEEKAEAIAHILARQMDFHEDEEALFVQLYQCMMRHRVNDADEKTRRELQRAQ